MWLLAYVPLLYDAEMPPRFISGMRTPGAISTLSFPIGGGCCSSFAAFEDETVTEAAEAEADVSDFAAAASRAAGNDAEETKAAITANAGRQDTQRRDDILKKYESCSTFTAVRL